MEFGRSAPHVGDKNRVGHCRVSAGPCG